MSNIKTASNNKYFVLLNLIAKSKTLLTNNKNNKINKLSKKLVKLKKYEKVALTLSCIYITSCGDIKNKYK